MQYMDVDKMGVPKYGTLALAIFTVFQVVGEERYLRLPGRLSSESDGVQSW
jgi:hypothetical protein